MKGTRRGEAKDIFEEKELGMINPEPKWTKELGIINPEPKWTKKTNFKFPSI